MNLLQQVSAYFSGPDHLTSDLTDQEDVATSVVDRPSPFEGTGTTDPPDGGSDSGSDSWSSSDPLRFQMVKEWVQDQDVPATLATRFVEQWGQRLRSGNSFPDIFDLTSNPDFMNGINSMRNYTTIGFPNAFKVQMPDGSIVAYQNSLTHGLREMPQFPSRGFGSAGQWEQNLPVYTLDQFQQTIQALKGKPKGGGGGGGGAGRGEFVVDKNQLKRSARDMWRRYLLDEPTNVDSMVNDYVADASNFWKTKGGRRDFDTWMLDRIENSQRGRMLYNKRPDGMTMDQYLAEFSNTVAQVGLSGDMGQQAVARGMQSGADAVPFADQLERSREVMSQQQGSFSQKFANTLGQLGIRGT